MTPSPLPVNVVHLPPDPLAWATFIAAALAAVAALVTLYRLAQRSSLTANFPIVEQAGSDGYNIGCNVQNSGNRGVRDFRITYAFSPPCRVNPGLTSTNHIASFGANDIDGRPWATAAFIAGPMYAHDPGLWVATVHVEAPPGEYDVVWHIESEDGRIPNEGWSKRETIRLAGPPASTEEVAPQTPNANQTSLSIVDSILDSKESATMAVVPPPSVDEYVFLRGRPPVEEYVGFLVGQSIGGQNLNQRALVDEWREANDRVRQLEQVEAQFADGMQTTPVAESLALSQARVLADPMLRRGMYLPYEIAVVELDRLVVFQKYINVTYVRELQGGLPAAPDDEQLFDFCLPVTHPVPAVQGGPTGNGFVFASPSNDFRHVETVVLDPANLANYEPHGPVAHVIGVVLGYGPNYLSAVRVEGRFILSNGSHRAYALRDRGITHAPVILQQVSRRDELGLAALSVVAQAPERFLTDPRPPLLKDYFDPLLRRVLYRQKQQRQVRIVVGVEQIDVPST